MEEEDRVESGDDVSLFRKYGSLTPLAQRHLTKLQSRVDPRVFADVEWVATEKAHGANFSMAYDGHHVQAGKRNGPLRPGDVFHGWEAIVLAHKHALEQLSDLVPEVVQRDRAAETEHASIAYTRSSGGGDDGDGDGARAQCDEAARATKATLVVYGELFGGRYFHPDVPLKRGQAHVQRDIHYCPDVRFAAFDVFFTGYGYMGYDDAHALLTQCGFFTPQLIERGSFNDVMNVNVEELHTCIPTQLGLPKEPKPGPHHLAEGVVIRPCRRVHVGGHARLVLKKKRAAFVEMGTKQRQHKGVKPMPELCAQALEQCEVARGYVCRSRLVNVLSHREAPKLSERGRVIAELIQDALKDYRADAGEAYDDLTGAERKRVRAQAAREAEPLVVKHWSSIVKGTFGLYDDDDDDDDDDDEDGEDGDDDDHDKGAEDGE